MSWKFLARLRGRLRPEAVAGANGALLYRIGLTLGVSLFVLALLAIGRIAWTLTHAAVWVNYRGSVVTHGQMYLALALSIATALGSLGIVVLLRRTGRPGRR